MRRVAALLGVVAAALAVGWLLLRREDGPAAGRDGDRGVPALAAPATVESEPPPPRGGLEGRTAPTSKADQRPVEPGPRRLAIDLRHKGPRTRGGRVLVFVQWDDGGVAAILDASGVRPETKASDGVRLEAVGDTRLVVDGLPPGTARVRAQMSGTHAHSRTVQVDLARRATTEVTLELLGPESYGRVEVTVMRGGLPVADVEIAGFDGSRRTGLDGSASISDLPGATNVSVVDYPGAKYLGLPLPAPQTVVVETGRDAAISFELPNAPEVRFRVLDPEGRPVRAGVQVLRVARGGSREFWNELEQIRWKEERQVLSGLMPPGDYEVWVSPGEKYLPVVARFSVEADDVTRDVDVRLRDEGLAATVTLVGPDGSPVAGTAFNVNRIARRLEECVAAHATTDAQGRATLTGLRSGRYRLMLWDLGLSKEVEVVDSAATWHVALPPDVERTARLALRLRHASGERVSESVVVRRSGAEWARILKSLGDGTYRSNVEPGASVVEVLWTPISWATEFRDVHREVVLREGENEEVEVLLSR